jgi:AraC family transcriptional activator of pobA
MHYRVEHRPVEYARMLCLSPGQLRKSCRQAQGFPPLHFIQHRIGMGAVSLLAHSQLSIQEIAWELGFEDADYFSRFFHKKFLFTPTAFRRALAG